MRVSLPLTVLALAAAQSASAQADGIPIVGTTVVDFESGAAGWGGGATFIDPSGGNGGGAGLRVINNAFGITFSTASNTAFLGDFTLFSDVTLSIDTIVHQLRFFGSPVSRPWLVELRDFDTAQGGYPWTSVWYEFGTIAEGSNGTWKTQSVTIADPTSTTLPAGWGGYGDETPLGEPILPPGVTFADVLSGVDEIAFTTFEPGFFFGFTDFDVVVDNITITANVTPLPAAEVVRAGAPANPSAFMPGVTSAPIIGQVWDPVIDHSSFLPSATVDAAIFSPGPANVPVGALGTLLCDLTVAFVLPGTAGVAFAVPIPNDARLLGVSLCVQGVSASPTAGVRLANALDITFGSF